MESTFKEYIQLVLKTNCLPCTNDPLYLRKKSMNPTEIISTLYRVATKMSTTSNTWTFYLMELPYNHSFGIINDNLHNYLLINNFINRLRLGLYVGTTV